MFLLCVCALYNAYHLRCGIEDASFNRSHKRSKKFATENRLYCTAIFKLCWCIEWTQIALFNMWSGDLTLMRLIAVVWSMVLSRLVGLCLTWIMNGCGSPEVHRTLSGSRESFSDQSRSLPALEVIPRWFQPHLLLVQQLFVMRWQLQLRMVGGVN